MKSLKRPLAMLASIYLALLWHGLGVMLFLPIGGVEAHWVFRRPPAGIPQAMFVVIADYSLLAIALLLFLTRKTFRSALVVVLGTVAGSSAASAYLVLGLSADEIVYPLLILGVPLIIVAAALWRLRLFLPLPFAAMAAAAPGTWSIWELFVSPLETSSRLPGGAAIAWLYPVSFVSIALLAFWMQGRNVDERSKMRA